MPSLLALLVTFGLMWALLIRPQQRRLRQHQAVVASLRPGDEVVTAGGIYGRIQSVDDDTMILEVAPGLELKVLRAAVTQRVAADDSADEDDEDDEDDDDRAYDEDDDDLGYDDGDDGEDFETRVDAAPERGESPRREEDA